MQNNDSQIPIAYQKGWIEFYKLRFKVTPEVLIPRPETELLVDEVLLFSGSDPAQAQRIHHLDRKQGQTLILDIGTGAGAIAIALAKNLRFNLEGCSVKIIATEISKKALEVAKLNAKFHKVEDKIEFILSDLLENCHIPQDDNLIIVTNLPYIPSARIPYLESSVKDFEPHIALDGGEDGFELYRQLFGQIKDKKWRPKLIIGEVDYTHGELAFNEAYKYFPRAEIEVKKDLAHMQRILTVKNP